VESGNGLGENQLPVHHSMELYLWGLALISASGEAAWIQVCPENIIFYLDKTFCLQLSVDNATKQTVPATWPDFSPAKRNNEKAQTEASSGNITRDVFRLQT